MNANQTPDDLRAATAHYVESVDVPPIEPPTLRHIAANALPPSPPPRRIQRPRIAFAGAVAALALVAVLANVPAVIAQVNRVMEAFGVVNGRPVPLEVRDVSFDQLRADMPFTIVAPAAVPAGLVGTIREISSPTDRNLGHATFEYRANSSGPPLLTIDESLARPAGAGPQTQQLMIVATDGKMGPGPHIKPGSLPAPVPDGVRAVDRECFITANASAPHVSGPGAGSQQCFDVKPALWTVNGTQISMIAHPGTFSPAQLAAIQQAMSQ